MVSNHLYQLPGIFKIQILIFGPIFGLLGGPFLGSEGKKRPKNQNCSFSLFFMLKIFLNTISFNFFFLNGNYIYWEIFHFNKKFDLKKRIQIFFKNFPLVPPMDAYFSFGGPRVVAADLSCSRVASVHCDFVGVCGGAVFWPEKDSLKRANLSLGEILTRHRYIF